MTLAKAHTAIQSGDRVTALEALLDAWGTVRSPAIAEVIDVVSDDLTRSVPKIEAKARSAFQSLWLEVASHDDPVDMGRLLAVVATEPCTLMRDRVDRLAVRPTDPRIARALLAFAVREPCACTSTPNGTMWTAIFKILTATGDVRARPVIEAPLKDNRRHPGGFQRMLRERFEKLRTTLIDPPRLSDDDLGILEAVRARAVLLASGPAARIGARAAATSSTASELLGRVYGAPDDDAPRLVYADYLSERGDSHGELIVLQCRKANAPLGSAEAKREAALLRENARRWLGPLEPALAKENLVFERGFVAGCQLAFKSVAQRDQLLHHPAWATVRRFVSPSSALLVPSDASPMRGLREVSNVSRDLVREVADGGGFPAIRSVEFALDDVTDELDFSAVCTAFPKLERAALIFTRYIAYDLGELRWALDGAWPEAMDSLEIAAYPTTSGVRIAEWLESTPPRIKTLRFDLRIWLFTALRAGGSWSVSAKALNSHAENGWHLETYKSAVSGLDSVTLTRWSAR